MRRSDNEIHSMVRKACLGEAIDVGKAEEVASACVWLIQRNENGISQVIHCLYGDTKNSLVNGPTIIDRCMAQKESIELTDIASPLLLAGFAGVAAHSFECRFELKLENSSKIEIWGNKLVISGASIMGSTGILSKHMPEDGPDDESAAQPVEVKTVKTSNDIDDVQWAMLEKSAQKTYVKSSDASRLSGAGAGLNDND